MQKSFAKWFLKHTSLLSPFSVLAVNSNWHSPIPNVACNNFLIPCGKSNFAFSIFLSQADLLAAVDELGGNLLNLPASQARALSDRLEEVQRRLS